MTNIQPKKQSQPSKTSQFFPMDMSWDHMDKMFSNLRNQWPFRMTDESIFAPNDLQLNPSVDIKEDEKAYMISAELPGLDASDINVDISDNVLTISGEKKSEKKEGKEDNYHVMERRYGYFKRSFSLPVSVQQEKIKADFKKGVLTVNLPKSEKAVESQRRIKIDD